MIAPVLYKCPCKQQDVNSYRNTVNKLLLFFFSGFVGNPLPGVEVRVASFQPGQEDYEMLCEGTNQGTVITPGQNDQVIICGLLWSHHIILSVKCQLLYTHQVLYFQHCKCPETSYDVLDSIELMPNDF